MKSRDLDDVFNKIEDIDSNDQLIKLVNNLKRIVVSDDLMRTDNKVNFLIIYLQIRDYQKEKERSSLFNRVIRKVFF